MNLFPRLAGIVLTSALLASALAAQEPTLQLEGYAPLQGKFFTEGKAAKVSLKSATMTKLVVTYRPASKVAQTDTLTATGGSVNWTPKAAGLVKLDAYYGADKPVTDVVSVAFAHWFTSGLVVMFVAGVLLFGGAFVSIRALLSRD
jgi:hypothetical protein